MLRRRWFLKAAAAAAPFVILDAASRCARAAEAVARAAGSAEGEAALPPVRQITRGPKHHWFGYDDKRQFDPTGRYALGMEVDFEGRSPRPDAVITMGRVDLAQSDRWTAFGESCA